MRFIPAGDLQDIPFVHSMSEVKAAGPEAFADQQASHLQGQILLAEDTPAMAEHAVTQGWIDGQVLVNIQAEMQGGG